MEESQPADAIMGVMRLVMKAKQPILELKELVKEYGER